MIPSRTGCFGLPAEWGVGSLHEAVTTDAGNRLRPTPRAGMAFFLGRGVRCRLCPYRLLAVTILGCLMVVGCGQPAPHPAVGVELRGLPVRSVADATIRGPALTGRVTLLNFWGTWCPPCRRELPGLVRIAQGLADDARFQFIPVSIGAGGDDDDLAAETARFLASQRVDLNAWVFADSVGGMMFGESIGLRSLPTTYLIGPDARINRVWNGYRPSDEADIAAAILSLLKKTPH
jgi:thiol-disulfide isomerase/thioredoxin